jgi:hypothetical protein
VQQIAYMTLESSIIDYYKIMFTYLKTLRQVEKVTRYR